MSFRAKFRRALCIAVVLCCYASHGQAGQNSKHLRRQDLRRIVYCLLHETSDVALPGTYWSRNGEMNLRYWKGKHGNLYLRPRDVVLAAYSPTGKDAQIYIVWIADDEGRPEFTLRQMAHLFKQKGRWRSEYPMQGGLGSLEELERIHATVVKRPAVVVSRAEVKRANALCPKH
jgi:hypothetical protein